MMLTPLAQVNVKSRQWHHWCTLADPSARVQACAHTTLPGRASGSLAQEICHQLPVRCLGIGVLEWGVAALMHHHSTHIGAQLLRVAGVLLKGDGVIIT